MKAYHAISKLSSLFLREWCVVYHVHAIRQILLNFTPGASVGESGQRADARTMSICL